MIRTRERDGELFVSKHDPIVRIIGVAFAAGGVALIASLHILFGLVFFGAGAITFFAGAPIDLRLSKSRMVVQRGGVFGFGRVVEELPLAAGARADVESSISGKSRLIFSHVVIAGVTLSGGSLAENRRVADEVNRFLGAPPADFTGVLERALGEPAGTVLVDGGLETKFARFCVTENGYVFYEPQAGITIAIGSAPQEWLAKLLEEHGLVPKRLPDAMTAPFGRDFARIESFSKALLKTQQVYASFDRKDVYFSASTPVASRNRDTML